MSFSTQFGPAFLAPEFDSAVEAFIQAWIDTYLSEVELRMGYKRRSIDRPKSYNAAIDVTHWPEEKLPGVLVVSAGFPDELTSVGNGLRAGWWRWAVVALVSGRDYESTRLKTGIYQAALRMLLEQKSNLGGAVDETVLLSEPMDYAPFEGRDRTRGVAAFELQSYISAAVATEPGPTEPDPTPPPSDPDAPHPDWPTVQTVDVSVTATDLTA